MIESDLPWAFGQPNGKGFQVLSNHKNYGVSKPALLNKILLMQCYLSV